MMRDSAKAEQAGIAILVVDDEAQVADKLGYELAQAGYEVMCKDNWMDGLIAVEDDEPTVVVLRWDLPPVGGPIFVRAMRAVLPRMPVVVALMRGMVDEAALQRYGVNSWLSVPAEPGVLVGTVRAILGTPLGRQSDGALVSRPPDGRALTEQ